jgi:hypothetical protein
MTTTVKRGAGRPAASERATRHAQRTPLPPKQRTVEDAREAIAEATADSCPKENCQRLSGHPGRHGKRTQSEQRLLDATPAASAEETAAAYLPRMGDSESATVEPNKIETQTQTGLQTEPQNPGDSKSWAKAMAFRAEVAKLGWTATVGHPQDGAEIDLVEVLASRGEEHLYISWLAGGLQHPVTYTIETRTIKMRNASQAKKYAARSEAVASAELGKVASNRAFKPRATEPKRSRLPFDPATAGDAEVITSLLGKSVAWHNSISQQSESGTVGRDASRIQIREMNGGERTIEFCCAAGGGFRAFHLSALTRVGGGRRSTALVAGGRVDIEELPQDEEN